jgi:hypothetical protein
LLTNKAFPVHLTNGVKKGGMHGEVYVLLDIKSNLQLIIFLSGKNTKS